MKKNLSKFSLLCAMALASVIGFSGCSSDEAVVNTNPDYNPVTNTVKTSFAFNFASDAVAKQKQYAAIAQLPSAVDGSNFRGMTDMQLLTFDGKPTTHNFSQNYKLGTLGNAEIGNQNANPSSKCYTLYLPIGTDNVLFYGKAPSSTASVLYTDAANTTNESQGKISFSIANTKDNTVIALTPRVSTSNVATFNSRAAVMAAILTSIGRASGSANIEVDGTPVTFGPYYWSNFKTSTDPMYFTLKEAFEKVCTTDEQIRAGSGPAVLKMVQDLYSSINALAYNAVYIHATPGSTERIICIVATGITEAIENFFVTTGSGASKQVTGFKTPSAIGTALTEAGFTDEGTAASGMTAGALSSFPYYSPIWLPEGAAQYTCALASDPVTIGGTEVANQPTFTYVNATGSGSLLGASSSVATKIMYPAELTYWCNSPLRVIDSAVTSDDFPKTTTAWDTEGNWTDWTSATVGTDVEITSSTRGVAVKNNINYGTALLKTTVQYGTLTLKDNRKHFFSAEEDDELTITGASDFTLSGVLVGGQVQNMRWNFIPDNEAVYDKIVYDRSIETATIPATAETKSSPNYTLVWDNLYRSGTYSLLAAADKDEEQAHQKVVTVALEFVNNKADFWGKDNLIRTGQKFYLLGTLDPNSSSATAIATGAWPTGTYRLPVLNEDYTGANITRVFIQDFTTTANFTIGATSLQKAYATLPDLQAIDMEVGLSVDLEWRNGLEFNMTF